MTSGVPSLADLPAGVVAITAEERPDLWSRAAPLFEAIWPEYNMHGDFADEYFSLLVPRFSHLQFLLYDEAEGRPVARGRSIPFAWDGLVETLPSGIDALGLQAISDGAAPTALSALAAEVVGDHQGRGLSRLVVQTMATLATRHGLAPLVAPVRPSWKDRYPMTPISQYAAWHRSDGLPFDPWMRVHARLGGRVLRPEPHSMRISAPVEEWEAWTGLALPDDGSFVFPAGLAPLEVRSGVGRYWEPNVWMCHDV